MSNEAYFSQVSIKVNLYFVGGLKKRQIDSTDEVKNKLVKKKKNRKAKITLTSRGCFLMDMIYIFKCYQFSCYYFIFVQALQIRKSDMKIANIFFEYSTTCTQQLQTQQVTSGKDY